MYSLSYTNEYTKLPHKRGHFPMIRRLPGVPRASRLDREREREFPLYCMCVNPAFDSVYHKVNLKS